MSPLRILSLSHGRNRPESSTGGHEKRRVRYRDQRPAPLP
jgi:hypothetical protein